MILFICVIIAKNIFLSEYTIHVCIFMVLNEERSKLTSTQPKLWGWGGTNQKGVSVNPKENGYCSLGHCASYLPGTLQHVEILLSIACLCRDLMSTTFESFPDPTSPSFSSSSLPFLPTLSLSLLISAKHKKSIWRYLRVTLYKNFH